MEGVQSFAQVFVEGGASPESCWLPFQEALNFFRGPQLRAARPWIAINLFFAGSHRLFRQDLVDPRFSSVAQSVFYDAVLQRVKADHHQPASRFQDARRCFHKRLQVVQFAVYEDSDSLETGVRWMNLLRRPEIH